MSAGTAPPLRVAVVGIVVISLFATLFARLYYLQVLRQTSLEEVRGGPLFREVAYQGPRGRILDRNGQILVDNREAIMVTIDRREFELLDDQQDLLLRLTRALNRGGVPVKVADLEARLADLRYDPFKPVPVAEDVSPELEAYLLERLYQFPSVDVTRVQVRTYPHGSIAAHLLGYIGPIDSNELTARAESPKPYEPGDDIGKAGVERIFEGDLRATPGKRTIEIDARHVEIATRAVTAPQPGSDLQLTIDLDLQIATEHLLAQALLDARQQRKRSADEPDYRAPAGAAIVLDVTNGEVLAMASNPTFNPAEFVGGISTYRFGELNDPSAFAPFNNRAIQAIYSPGSTFKPFTAVAALKAGLQRPDERIVDRGVYELDNCSDTCVFQNAGRIAYGPVDLRRAMVVSSDVYFYRLGEQFWVRQGEFGQNAMQSIAMQFGMGSPTGVQLPDEASGLVTTPLLKAQRHASNPDAFPYGEWYTGDNVNLAIGQGDLGVTPLQLANAYAALANGGTVLAPSVARATLDARDGTPLRTFKPRQLGHVPLPEEIRGPVLAGLEGAIADGEGTASFAFSGFPLHAFKLAGKTGTAEAPPRQDTALFAAFGPMPNPRYAVVTVLEEAGFSSVTAAPLAREIFERLDEVRPLVAPEPPGPSSPPATTPEPSGERDDRELAAPETPDAGPLHAAGDVDPAPAATRPSGAANEQTFDGAAVAGAGPPSRSSPP